MGLPAGRLDRRITILRAGTVDSGMGRRSGAPAVWKKFWARRQDVSDGEKVRAAQQGSAISVRFVVRASTDTRTINPATDTVRDRNGQVFNIVGIKETPDGRDVGLEISCSATKGASA